MAALLENHLCPVCRDRHDFFIVAADMIDGNARYQFICPKRKTEGVFTSSQMSTVTRLKTPGVVILTELPRE